MEVREETLTGLSPDEAEALLRDGSEEDWLALFRHAREITRKNFQDKIEFFAPLYYSDYCVNDCSYCSFRVQNRRLPRKSLSTEELLKEAGHLWREGHRSLLFVAGEHEPIAGVPALIKYAEALKKSEYPFKLAAETGALDCGGYAQLAQAGIARNVLYQETYDRRVYAKVHLSGPKRDFDWRYEAPFRALRSGIRSLGMGVLLGIAPDWKKEILGLFRHAGHLRSRAAGLFSLTFSFPRLRPAHGSAADSYPVGDSDYQRIVALARVSFPEAGIVLSTRETAAFRREMLQKKIGVTHMSAGASTEVGGYALGGRQGRRQFEISDTTSLRGMIELSDRMTQVI